MSDDFQYKRATAVERRIGEIMPETDMRVKLLASILEKQGNSLVLDDGSGRVAVATEQAELHEIGDTIMVIAKLIPNDAGFELQAEIIKNMKKLDINLYRLASNSNKV